MTDIAGEIWTGNETRTARVSGRTPVPWTKKINPIFWLQNGWENGWRAPLSNNNEPYLPNIKNQLARNFFWFCRNPFANFVEFVIGVKDRNFVVYSTRPPANDTVPSDSGQRGFKASIIMLCGWFPLPYLAWSGGIECYLGWRPEGHFGAKLATLRADAPSIEWPPTPQQPMLFRDYLLGLAAAVLLIVYLAAPIGVVLLLRGI